MQERWEVRAFAEARLVGPAERSVALDRRTAALLVYLLREGSTPRSRLAGLLYADVAEVTARNNLAQLLLRLKRSVGEPLVQGDALLEASPAVTLAFDLETTSAQTLLSTFDFSDLPDFEDWLMARREQLSASREAHLARRAAELEEAERYAEATEAALALLKSNELSEEAWRRVIRLRYLAGEQQAALEAFEACRRVLRDQLGAEPSAETERLADEVKRGAQATVPRVTVVPQRPHGALRSPDLVGRELEWAAMEDAWARGLPIFLSGAPGVGKSRLAYEFASSKGAVARQEARPGDATVPYAAAARNLRRILRAYPDAASQPWVRRELSRILPELSDDGAPLEPMREEAARTRFFEAAASVLAHEAAHVVCTVDDDTQYYDRASFELGEFIFSQATLHAPPDRRPRLISTFRSNELPDALVKRLQVLCERGAALHLELQPLSVADVERLVASLDMPTSARHATALAHSTGGNPFFVLETVQHLVETEHLDDTLPERLLPRNVGLTITSRLARLSPSALLAARAAAVLQSDFDLDLVAHMLGAPLLSVAELWEELEAASVVNGTRFTHDLVYEAVEADIPATVRRMLHRRAAQALEERGAMAARVARHWQQGEDAARTAPWLLKAARQAASAFRVGEALEWCAHAQHLYERLGDASGLNEVARVRAAL